MYLQVLDTEITISGAESLFPGAEISTGSIIEKGEVHPDTLFMRIFLLSSCASFPAMMRILIQPRIGRRNQGLPFNTYLELVPGNSRSG